MKVDGYLASSSFVEIGEKFKKKYEDYKEKERAMLIEIRQKNENLVIRGIEKVQVSDTYNDLGHWMCERGRMRFQLSKDVLNDMAERLEQYYEGKISDEELAEAYTDICIKAGTSDSERLLDVYENFINESRYASNNACTKKGNEITGQYGSVDDHDAVYYDADFYYAFERVKQIARDVSSQMAEMMGWDEMDFDKVEAETRFTLDGGFDFNGKWKWVAENLMNRCTMIDPKVVPPEGFAFYYKESNFKGNSETGVLQIRTKHGFQEITVPFHVPKAGRYVDHFHLKELCSLKERDSDYYREYNAFFGNFFIYRRSYVPVPGWDWKE